MVTTRAKIKKAQKQSGALIGSDDNLLIEILRRMPVTSVLRFKSVSKHWQSLLSNRRFTLLYNKVSISPGLFVRNLYIPFDIENRNPPPFRNLDFYPDLSGIKIVQSCNGLLLCCSDQGEERARKYYVFNPTTKQFAIIPPVPGGVDVRKTIRFMGLAFHQTDCVHYKVVCIHRDRKKADEGLFQIQIYSSDTRKWKISDKSFSAPYLTSFYPGVYLNQAIHWAPSCLHPLYFKLDTEKMQSLPLPLPAPVVYFGCYQNEAFPCYFGESRGHLHLAVRESHLHLNVYEMLKDLSGWIVKYRVELHELPDAYPEMIYSYIEPWDAGYYCFQLFDVVRGEEKDETFMVIMIPGKIIRYNVADKSFNHVFDMPTIFDEWIGYREVHRYVPTLLSF